MISILILMMRVRGVILVRRKWKNKTPDEKEETLKKIETNKKKGKSYRLTSDRAIEIYKNEMAIPIYCFNHGYFSPRIYEVKIVNFYGEKYMSLRGKCPICEEPWDKKFPDPISEEGLLFNAAMMKLAREGRILDDR